MKPFRLVVAAVALTFSVAGPVFAQFGPPQNVSNNAGESAAPSVSLDGTVTQFVVWVDNTADSGGTDTDFRLRFVAFPPGGTAPASGVIPGIMSLDESLLPRTSTDSAGKLHVVFQNRVLNRYDIFYVASADNGVTWSAPFNVSSNTGDSATPAIAVDALGRLHAVWTDDTDVPGVAEVFYSKRSTSGVWSTPKNVSNRMGSVSAFPDIAITSDGRANVVWIDTTSGVKSIFFTREIGSGSFSTPRNVSGELFTGPLGDTGPALAVGVADRLHLVWAGAGNASGEDIFYQTAPAPTYPFTTPRNISNNTGVSTAPRLAVDSGDQAHVVWQDNVIDTDFDIFYAKVFAPGGGSTPAPIESTTGRSLLPDIRADVLDALHVCWQDDEGAPGVNFEILCADAPESVPPITTCAITPAPDPACANVVKADPATVTLTSTDNSGSVSQVTYRDNSKPPVTVSYGTCPTDPPFTTSFSSGGQGMHTIRFSATDCANNVEPEKMCKFTIDSVPPTTGAIVDGEPCACGFQGPVEVTLIASDPAPGTGVKSTTYSVDGGSPQTYSGPFTVSGDAVHTVTFQSEDKACNVESTETKTFRICTPLTVEITRPVNGALYINNGEVVLPPLIPPTQVGENHLGDSAIVYGNMLTVKAIVTSPDGSQIDDVALWVNDVLKATDTTDRPSGTEYSFTYNLPPPFLNLPGTQNIRVTAQDKAVPVPHEGSAERNIILAQ